MRLASIFVCAFVALPAAGARAQACFLTPEAAAQSIIGPVKADGAAWASGYRVQDVQADPLLRRAWIRVRRCDLSGGPLILVPLQAGLTGAATPLPQGLSLAPSPSSAAEVRSTVPRILALRAGEAVLVTLASAAVHMEVEGTANESAALGDMVDVTLRRRGDEPPHRIRGTLRADHRVEVQP